MGRPRVLPDDPSHKGVLWIPDRWTGKPRPCRECGKIVTSYKNPNAAHPLCYNCEDAKPWTYTYIVGNSGGNGASNRKCDIIKKDEGSRGA